MEIPLKNKIYRKTKWTVIICFYLLINYTIKIERFNKLSISFFKNTKLYRFDLFTGKETSGVNDCQ